MALKLKLRVCMFSYLHLNNVHRSNTLCVVLYDVMSSKSMKKQSIQEYLSFFIYCRNTSFRVTV